MIYLLCVSQYKSACKVAGHYDNSTDKSQNFNVLQENIMSTAIDNFTKQLHDDLEVVEDRAKYLKESIQYCAEKNSG